MAAKNANVSVPTGAAWTRLTDSVANVTSITIANRGATKVVIQGTTGAAPTSGTKDGIELLPGMILVNQPLGDLFPGVSATQVWARSTTVRNGIVFVSHGA